MPFVRPLSRSGQLNTMVNYLILNPQRLATKLLKPGFFRVQDGIEIAGRTYSGVGNAKLLQERHFMPVHVRRTMVDEAEHGADQRLRDYKNRFKPSDGLFDAVAEGRLLILSPWPFDPKKKQVTRAECVAMNQMAEEICSIIHCSE